MTRPGKISMDLTPAWESSSLGTRSALGGSPAYAAQLRLLGKQLARQINDRVDHEVVHVIQACRSVPSRRHL